MMRGALAGLKFRIGGTGWSEWLSDAVGAFRTSAHEYNAGFLPSHFFYSSSLLYFEVGRGIEKVSLHEDLIWKQRLRNRTCVVTQIRGGTIYLKTCLIKTLSYNNIYKMFLCSGDFDSFQKGVWGYQARFLRQKIVALSSNNSPQSNEIAL